MRFQVRHSRPQFLVRRVAQPYCSHACPNHCRAGRSAQQHWISAARHRVDTKLILSLGNLPKLFGGTEFTEGTLRFAWHITTVSWWAIAALLVFAHQGSLTTAMALEVIAVAALACAALPIVFTRGRHLSWVVFVLVAALVHFAA